MTTNVVQDTLSPVVQSTTKREWPKSNTHSQNNSPVR